LGSSEVDGLQAPFFLDLGISSMGQQDLDNLVISFLTSHHQRRPSSVIFFINFSPKSQQTFSDIHSSFLCCKMKRSFFLPSSFVFVDVCSRLDQSLDHVLPAHGCSPLDGLHGTWWFVVWVGSVLEEAEEDLFVSSLDGADEGCFPDLFTLIIINNEFTFLFQV